MTNTAKLYISLVIAGGAAVLVASAAQASAPRRPVALLVYLTFAMAASLIKLRLPGIAGSYSLNFLFLLFGILHFTLFETVLVSCMASLVQSLGNAKKRPTLVQILFNMANLILTIGLCFLAVRVVPHAAVAASRPAQLAVVSFLF